MDVNPKYRLLTPAMVKREQIHEFVEYLKQQIPTDVEVLETLEKKYFRE